MIRVVHSVMTTMQFRGGSHEVLDSWYIIFGKHCRGY